MSENSECGQTAKKASPASKRPALAIYRPPGTRNSTEKTDVNGMSSPPPAQTKSKESPEKKSDPKKKENNQKGKCKENNKKEQTKGKKEDNNNNNESPPIKHQKSKSKDYWQKSGKNNQNAQAKINNKISAQVDRQTIFHQQRRSKSRDFIKIGHLGGHQQQETATPPKSREAPAAFLRATPILGRKHYDDNHHANFSRPLNPEAAPFVPQSLMMKSALTNGAANKSLSPPMRTSSAPLHIGKTGGVKLDWPDARQVLIQLQLVTLMPFLDENGRQIRDQKKAEVAAQDLFRKVIETNSTKNNNKNVARALASFLERCDDTNAIHDAIGAELWQYFECRDSMRAKQFRHWLSFVSFTADVYSATGLEYDHETFVKVMLRNFEYMLHEPVLESLRIEELEAIISALLSCGYDLERQCPAELAALKDSIRDAFVQAREPWARKMILLLVELAASGWRLPPQAKEYYFEETNRV